MATSGAYKNSPFYFTYSFVDSADPTLIYSGSVANTDITIYTRTTNGTPTIYPLNSGNPATTVLSAGGVHTIALTAAEMNFDEIVLVCSGTGFVAENISICTEPAPSDILEVQSSAVSGIADFRATGFSTLVATDIISDGNPITATSGTISNVATTATVTDKAGYSISGTKTTLDALNDVAATDIVSAGSITTLSGAVVNVDTVDTCTTNSDMLSVSSIVNGVWDEAQTGHVTVGTFGYYLDSQISGISGGGGGTDWTATEKNQIRYRLGVDGTATAPSVNSPDIAQKSDIAALNDPAAADIADAVWDELQSGHNTPGTFGEYVDSNLNDIRTVVDSTATSVTSGFSDISLNGVILTSAEHNSLVADTADGVLDEALAGHVIAGSLGKAVADIESDATAILSDTGTTLPASLSTIEGKVDTVDAVADLIKVDTSAILDDTGTSGVTISTAQAQAIADEILKRSVSTGEATAAEHSLATIILSILESSRSATTWTIKRTDGLTPHLTKTLSLDGTALPVTGVSD